MSEHNMKHMEFLEAVTQDDVRVLREKEATYQGSWKRAGGRSAWFMMRRNMDRLIEMARKPDDPPSWNMQNVSDTIDAIGRATVGSRGVAEVSMPGTPEATVAMLKYLQDCYVAENIFAMVRKAPDGEDGTPLACLRDLRRYLILIEAEMMARDVIKTAVTKPVTRAKSEKRIPRMDDDVRYAPPWVVRAPSSSSDPGINPAIAEAFYHRLAPEVWTLEPHVETWDIPVSHVETWDIPVALDSLYRESVRGGKTLRINMCPPEVRGYFPRLPREQNMMEWEERPDWQRVMYYWHAGQLKYVLSRDCEAWAGEDE